MQQNYQKCTKFKYRDWILENGVNRLDSNPFFETD